MNKNRLPDFIYAGTAKAASSWIYKCLYDHPEVLMPEQDTINYFNINYHREIEWYREFFSEYNDESMIGEASTGYLGSRAACQRIFETLSEVKLIFCLRNPVERAYSQWWHGYSHGYHNYEFEEVFQSHPRYRHWVVPGFYNQHLRRFDELFSEDQIKVVFFDDLVEDDLSFIQDIYEYISVDADYVPEPIGKKENEAGATGNPLYVRARGWVRNETPDWFENTLKFFWDPVRSIVESRNQYEEGMDEDIRRQLEQVYLDDVRELSRRTSRDLDHWFEYEEL